MEQLKALTLWRPWPSIMVHFDPEKRKPVENRTWAPPAWMIGRQLALHAGSRWHQEGAEFIEEQTGIRYSNEGCPRGAIVGVGVVDRYFRREEFALFKGDDVQRDPLYRSPWAFGPYCWVLRDVVELAEPVPCNGAQGLWNVPPKIADEVREAKP